MDDTTIPAVPAGTPDPPRITVALIPKSADDLTRTRDRTNMSKTDIINRAITLYDFVDAEIAAGGQLVIVRPGGDRYLIKLL
jgi:hypothetical protein